MEVVEVGGVGSLGIAKCNSLEPKLHLVTFSQVQHHQVHIALVQALLVGEVFSSWLGDGRVEDPICPLESKSVPSQGVLRLVERAVVQLGDGVESGG